LSRKDAIALLGEYLAARDQARGFLYEVLPPGQMADLDAQLAELVRRSWTARLRILEAMTR
jgi:hypothetical protein